MTDDYFPLSISLILLLVQINVDMTLSEIHC